MKGLSKDDLDASATPLRCWQEAMAAREVGSCWRAQARNRVLEAEERDMAGKAIAVNCKDGRPFEGGGGGSQGGRGRIFQMLEVEVGGAAYGKSNQSFRFGITGRLIG